MLEENNSLIQKWLAFCGQHKQHEYTDLSLFFQPPLLLIGCFHLDPRRERVCWSARTSNTLLPTRPMHLSLLGRVCLPAGWGIDVTILNNIVQSIFSIFEIKSKIYLHVIFIVHFTSTFPTHTIHFKLESLCQGLALWHSTVGLHLWLWHPMWALVCAPAAPLPL